jgi:error-prone DNA polymerase
MTAGGEVVEDYRHASLSLRSHPVSFLREDLSKQRIVTCTEAMQARNARWLEAAGIILVRQRPGNAKGVIFITLEDESGVANLVIWPKVFENNRRIILSASMMAARGRVQREGDVVHLVAYGLKDLSPELASVGERGGLSLCPMGAVRVSSWIAYTRLEGHAKEARHLYSRPSHRYDQSTDERFKIGKRSSF